MILEGSFVFVFCKRESKYTNLLKCNLNTCMKVLEEPVTNVEYRCELRFTLAFPRPVTTPWSWRSFPNGIEQLIFNLEITSDKSLHDNCGQPCKARTAAGIAETEGEGKRCCTMFKA